MIIPEKLHIIGLILLIFMINIENYIGFILCSPGIALTTHKLQPAPLKFHEKIRLARIPSVLRVRHPYFNADEYVGIESKDPLDILDEFHSLIWRCQTNNTRMFQVVQKIYNQLNASPAQPAHEASFLKYMELSGYSCYHPGVRGFITTIVEKYLTLKGTPANNCLFLSAIHQLDFHLEYLTPELQGKFLQFLELQTKTVSTARDYVETIVAIAGLDIPWEILTSQTKENIFKKFYLLEKDWEKQIRYFIPFFAKLIPNFKTIVPEKINKHILFLAKEYVESFIQDVDYEMDHGRDMSQFVKALGKGGFIHTDLSKDTWTKTIKLLSDNWLLMKKVERPAALQGMGKMNYYWNQLSESFQKFILQGIRRDFESRTLRDDVNIAQYLIGLNAIQFPWIEYQQNIQKGILLKIIYYYGNVTTLNTMIKQGSNYAIVMDNLASMSNLQWETMNLTMQSSLLNAMNMFSNISNEKGNFHMVDLQMILSSAARLNVPWNVLVDNGLLNILTHRLQQAIQQLDDSSSYHPDSIDIQGIAEAVFGLTLLTFDFVDERNREPLLIVYKLFLQLIEKKVIPSLSSSSSSSSSSESVVGEQPAKDVFKVLPDLLMFIDFFQKKESTLFEANISSTSLSLLNNHRNSDTAAQDNKKDKKEEENNNNKKSQKHQQLHPSFLDRIRQLNEMIHP